MPHVLQDILFIIVVLVVFGAFFRCVRALGDRLFGVRAPTAPEVGHAD